MNIRNKLKISQREDVTIIGILNLELKKPVLSISVKFGRYFIIPLNRSLGSTYGFRLIEKFPVYSNKSKSYIFSSTERDSKALNPKHNARQQR